MIKLNALAAGQGVSAAGDVLAVVVLMLALQQQGAAPFVVSALVLVQMLPTVFLGPVLAPLLDRVETSRLLSLSLVARAVIGVGIAFAPSTSSLLVLVGAAAVVSAVDGPAMAMLVPTAVPDGRDVAVGYARSDTFRAVGSLVGPALAGVLVSAIGTKWTLLIDAATFVVLLFVIWALRLRRYPEPRPAPESWMHQIAAGPRTLFSDRVIAASVIALATAIVFTAMITVAQVFFVREGLHQTAAVYGLLVTVRALGRLVASSVIGPRVPAERQSVALWVGGLLMGGGLILVAGVPSLTTAYVGLFFVGVANSVQSLAIRSIVHQRAPRAVQGRAFAAMLGTNNAATMVGTGAGGPMVAALGGAGALLIGGVGTAMATLAASAWLFPRVRSAG